MATNPIQDVTFGTALQLSLNNYYDLLKAQVGGLNANEYLQLKLVADVLDMSTDYPWFSLLQLLLRSDQAIEPTATSDVILATAVTLAAEYENFLRQLVTYVVQVNLSDDDQKTVNALQLKLDGLRTQNMTWAINDRTSWVSYANAMGYDPGDKDMFFQWDAAYGHGAQIQDGFQQMNSAQFQINALLNKKWPEPADIEIVNAQAAFYELQMKMCYVLFPDAMYSQSSQFSLEYFTQMQQVDTALFTSRRVISWDKSVDFMKNAGAGSFAAHFDSSTNSSTSITSDWGGSASVSYAFISVNASASEHTQIQNDFSHATTMDLSAAATYKVGLVFPAWFQPSLFVNKRVIDNIQSFTQFFGPDGSLLYYPSHLICVRGFKAVFGSSQNWTYDYQHNFSASGGGGFNVCGIGFGGSASYSNSQKEHTVSQSNTTLTIADDPATIRFVGYGLTKNNVHAAALAGGVATSLGTSVTDSIRKAVLLDADIK